MTKHPAPGDFCRFAAIALFIASTMATDLRADPLSLTLRERADVAHRLREVEWDPAKTAVIVCDMWDSHHSVTAVRRVNEFAPRLNEVLKAARAKGATIIHSPSDCMPAYAAHPARKRALATPAAPKSPPDMGAWCHRIPGEEKAAYPIDQSDGGEDEDAWENDQWAARLEADGRKPGTPWLKQNALLGIADEDYIASEGDVVWNVLQHRGIEHVILSGVHTNMCVLGRPFGLRQMVRAGMETVLLRDMTDVMYNPARWPYVSHFTGLDLVVKHIEQYVCPTITSDQIVGGEPFRFKGDRRPHVSVVMGTAYIDELRAFARRYLEPSFRVSFEIGGIADSVRGDSPVDLYLVTGKVELPAKGAFGSKPVVFLHRTELPEGRSIRSDGGRAVVFYTGVVGDSPFDKQLFEALCWASDLPVPEELPADPDARRASEGWRVLGDPASKAKHRDLRTLLRTPTDLKPMERFLSWEEQPGAKVFLNGEQLARHSAGVWKIGAGALRQGDLNLLVLRTAAGKESEKPSLENPPSVVDGKSMHTLDATHWQERFSDVEDVDTGFPIPPQFGAPTDLIQNWPAGG